MSSTYSLNNGKYIALLWSPVQSVAQGLSEAIGLDAWTESRADKQSVSFPCQIFFSLIHTYKNWRGGGWGLKYIEFFFFLDPPHVHGWGLTISWIYTWCRACSNTGHINISTFQRGQWDSACLWMDLRLATHLTWSFMHAPTVVQLIGSSWAAEERKLGPLRLLWLEHSITTTTNHHHN